MITNLEVAGDAFFPVKKVQYLRQIEGGEPQLSAVAVELRHGQTGEELGYASKDYGVLTHEEALMTVSDALDRIGVSAEIDQFALSPDCKRMKLSMRVPEVKYTPPDGHEVCFSMLSQNSLDGSLKYVCRAGMLRWICLNLSVTGTEFVTLFTKHTANVKSRVDAVAGAIEGMLTNASSDMQRELDPFFAPMPKEIIFRGLALDQRLKRKGEIGLVEKPVGWVLSDPDMLAYDFVEHVGHRARIAQKYQDRAKEEMGTSPDTFWKAYNGFTFALTHGSPNWMVAEQGLSGARKVFHRSMEAVIDGRLLLR